MTRILENDSLQFSLDAERSCWSLHPLEEDLALAEVHVAVDYRRGRTRCQTLAQWDVQAVSEAMDVSSPHGPLRLVNLCLAPDVNGLRCTLDFALPAGRSLLLWRLIIYNEGRQPVYLDRLTLLDTSLQSASSAAQSAFFSNGWGSWNHTGAYSAGDRFRRTRLGPFTAPMRVNSGTPQPGRPGHFASDMFAVLGDRLTRRAVLAGFLSQEQHFGSLEVRLDKSQPVLRMWANGDGARLDPGASISTDWACLHYLNVDAPDPLGIYIEAVARQAGIHNRSSKIPTGWCSWYQFYQSISAQDVRRNLRIAAEQRPRLPLDAIQIDDGFETQVGDWLSFRPTFPEGVAPLAGEIEAAGFTPGLWLAPFIVQRSAHLVHEHPEWLLRGRFNRPVNAGFIWDQFTTALDLTHPEALEYACQVVDKAVHEWGFPYLKLDFLYAATLPGRYRDPTQTRAQVLRHGLEALRQTAGEDTFLLGCGCPLGSAIGLVDAMRIGADVAPRWRPFYLGTEFYFQAEPDMPSARNAIQNDLTRAPLHRRWWINDPDCLLIRQDSRLNLAEVQSLATVIILSGGMLLLSDDLSQVSPERLRIARTLLPLIGERPRLPDWFDAATPRCMRLDLNGACGEWRLLALFNWGDRPQEATLRVADYDLEPGLAYWGREFWSGQIHSFSKGEVDLGRLPTHSVALLALRQVLPDQPRYLGGDLHVSQGQEVAAWNWQAATQELRLRLERPGRTAGHIDLALPSAPEEARLNGAPLVWDPVAKGCYRFSVEFESVAELKLTMEG